jgi:predicted DNA-binding mobile mystery protein A
MALSFWAWGESLAFAFLSGATREGIPSRESEQNEGKGHIQPTCSPPVQIHRSIARRQLDKRLGGLAEHLGTCPANGWSRTIRLVLGMSTVELAQRLAVAPPRIRQLERGEIDGNIRLSTLRRVAAALNCQLLYVFVPDEPLEDMVRRQARLKAAEEIALRISDVRPEDEAFVARLLDEELDARARELIDTPGLWRANINLRPGAPPPA